MRVVVVGAGAIGGVLASRLSAADNDVAVVARGRHLEAIVEGGLRVRDANGETVHRMPAVADVGKLGLTADDLVVLAVKTQDSAAVLASLARVAPPDMAVACAQNGVENERLALRFFANVYGIHVVCPATHLEPGVVVADSTPITGVLDVGRYPHGVDDVSEWFAAALNGATYDSQSLDDVMRWKHRKLLGNLRNVIEVVCGTDARDDGHELSTAVGEEGERCLAAAGIDVASKDEYRERRGDHIQMPPPDVSGRVGSSTMQSLVRGVSLETDYLNGEIVRLGREVGVPTPINATLQQLAHEVERAASNGETFRQRTRTEVLAAAR